MKILIVGAGIGGAALAAALTRRGIDYDLVERRAVLADEGAGVVLGPNVMAALGPLGLDEAVAARGRPAGVGRVIAQNGRVLGGSAYQIEGYRWPGIAIHRAALHQVLRGGLAAQPRLGLTCEAIEAHDGGVEVRFSDGSAGRYDLVVGADGVHSALRDALNPGFSVRYSGYTCWRYVFDGTVGDGTMEMWGRGRRLGVVPLGEGKTYVFLTLNAPRNAPAPFDTPEAFRATWAGFPAPADEALAQVRTLSMLLHNDICDGIPDRWWAPRRILIGDAAHAVTPNLGQGAGLAVEDAACLAALIAEEGVGDATLARFEALRRPRATWIRDNSWNFGRVSQLENGALRALRDLALRLTPASVNHAALRRVVTDMPGVPI